MILTQPAKQEKENLEVSWPIIINQYSIRNKRRKQKTVGNESKQFHVFPNSISADWIDSRMQYGHSQLCIEKSILY